MELALASDGFVAYTYTGKATILLDDHHDEFTIDFQTDDRFKVKLVGTKVTIIHLDEPSLQFTATTTDKAYLRIMKYSTPDEFQFVPHPKYPAYPFLPNLTFEMVPKIYAYFNDKLFNGMCPKKLLFKKTQGTSSPLGLAQLDHVKGQPIYRMTVNVKKISVDTILFVDVLIHEMIHLYLYRKGLLEHNNSITQDGHGPYFQGEMKRLNKLGYNISIILEWEKREIEADVEANVIRVTLPGDTKNTKYYWSLKPLEDSFDDLVKQLRAQDPTKPYVVELLVTSDHAAKGYPQISNSGKIPPSKIALWWPTRELRGRVVKTFNTQEQGHTAPIGMLKVAKKEEPFYAQPFSLFSSWMERTKATGTEDQLRALWIRFPVAKILPFAEEELVDIAKALDRGLSDAEIKRKLTAVFARFDDRCPQYEYRKVMREIITRRHLEVLLTYPQLGL